MRMYSQSTGCSYLPGINSKIPNDAVEISEKTFREVLAVDLKSDKSIGHTEDGQPFLVERVRTKQEMDLDGRNWRDAEIDKLRWLGERHRDQLFIGSETTLSQDHFAELLAYIQYLRNWPEVSGFPADESKPVPPKWLLSTESAS